MSARLRFRWVPVVVLLGSWADARAEEPPVRPEPAPKGQCRAASSPAIVADPDRNLHRLEAISEALKKTTMDGICAALRASDFVAMRSAFTQDASVQRLFPRREQTLTQHAGTAARLVAPANPKCFGDPQDFAADLRELLGPVARLDRCFFKPFRVLATTGEGRRALAHFHLWLGWELPTGARVGEKGDVVAEMREDAKGAWRISHLEFQERERFESAAVAFRDLTRAAGLPTAWPDEGVLGGSYAVFVLNWGPVSVADFDGDGWPDLYLPRAGRDLLLRNNGRGGFEDVTERAKLGDPGFSQAAIFADFDNDGRPDLFVVQASYVMMTTDPGDRHHRLYRNNGDGTFTRMPERFGAPGPASGASVADYDGDGLLDIYVTYYQDWSRVQNTDLIDARDGYGNRLFHNEGGFRFKDVTASARVAGHGWALASAWADYNGDGKIDLFVANDFGDSQLFRNRGDGTFYEIAEQAGVAGPGNGMSADWGDFDNDGKLDLLVANMYSKAANQFLAVFPHLNREVRKRFLISVQGNALYRNLGDGTFENVATKLGTNLGGWAWGSNFLDYDNDGWLDIHVANGYVESPGEGPKKDG